MTLQGLLFSFFKENTEAYGSRLHPKYLLASQGLKA